MIGKFWRGLVFALTLCMLVAGLLYLDWVQAQVRTIGVLVTVGRVPVLAWVASVLTDEPRITEIVVAGEPTTLARPGGGRRWPAVVFLNGATDRGRFHPDVQRLARGLARAGYLVLVPELPGLRRYELTEQTLRAAVAVAKAAAARPDARGGRVSLIGVSTGTTLALLVAEDPALAGRVRVAAGIAPFTDLRRVIELATTGWYPSDRGLVRYQAKDFLGLAIGRSVVAGLQPGRDRDRLGGALARVGKDERDPLHVLRGRRFRGLGPAARSTVALLANRDPRRFDALFAALPASMRESLRSLSPALHAASLRARVELATAPHDKYFPVEESQELARRAPSVHVTVTSTLRHAIPKLSLGAIGDLLGFDAYAVRVLHDAG